VKKFEWATSNQKERERMREKVVGVSLVAGACGRLGISSTQFLTRMDEYLK
jgi:hypothetical protein